VTEEALADLERRLRDADAEELLTLVRQHATEIGVPAARQVLRNTFVTGEIIEALIAQRALMTSYEMRREITLHPRTPQVLALRFVPRLFWRDLVQLGRETRVKPVVRRAADRDLLNRLPSLGAGEKMAIARQAGPGVLVALRHDPSPRVMSALLENPRLTEGILAPTLSSEATPPNVLRVIAGNRLWSNRYGVRVTLARNPRTPTEVSLRILPTLKKPDLESVASDVRLGQVIRRRARLLLGGEV
jgi:hypothetical protein